MNNLPLQIKNTIDFNIQKLSEYKFYDIKSYDDFNDPYFNEIKINTFEIFNKPNYGYNLFEQNSKWSKIFIDLDGLPINFNIIKFVDDFNEYLKTIKYEKYEKSKLTPIYLITKNENSSNHIGESYHIIVNYNSYILKDIIYMIADFSVLYSQYKPYIDLSVYACGHYLRCINQYNIKRKKEVNSNDIHYIYKIYIPEYKYIDLIKILDDDVKILLSFININENKSISYIIKDIEVDNINERYCGDYNNLIFSDLILKLVQYHKYLLNDNNDDELFNIFKCDFALMDFIKIEDENEDEGRNVIEINE